jgi:2-polyprenyl-6-methoxyphenol hydroxylase-like FAD-dependent oxidoreductase
MHDGARTNEDPAYDAVIVGASLAGCTTAIALGRAGARVALVEKRPDPAAFKLT